RTVQSGLATGGGEPQQIKIPEKAVFDKIPREPYMTANDWVDPSSGIAEKRINPVLLPIGEFRMDFVQGAIKVYEITGTPPDEKIAVIVGKAPAQNQTRQFITRRQNSNRPNPQTNPTPPTLPPSAGTPPPGPPTLGGGGPGARGNRGGPPSGPGVGNI